MKCKRCGKLITDIRNFNIISINTPALSKLENTNLCTSCKDVFETQLNIFMDEVRIYKIKEKIEKSDKITINPNFEMLTKELFADEEL